MRQQPDHAGRGLKRVGPGAGGLAEQRDRQAECGRHQNNERDKAHRQALKRDTADSEPSHAPPAGQPADRQDQRRFNQDGDERAQSRRDEQNPNRSQGEGAGKDDGEVGDPAGRRATQRGHADFQPIAGAGPGGSPG